MDHETAQAWLDRYVAAWLSYDEADVAALFAEDDERGLLGGAITAIGLSGANVTLGFIAGFLGLRYLQHRHVPMKALGTIAFAFVGVLALMPLSSAQTSRAATGEVIAIRELQLDAAATRLAEVTRARAPWQDEEWREAETPTG